MKICTFNVENLFFNLPSKNIDNGELPEYQNYSIYINNEIYTNKNFAKIEEIASYIKDIDADIVGLVEIGGKDSLSNFNKYFLDSAYDCYLIESCSSRPIYTGFLIKKILDFDEINYLDIGNNRKTSRNIMYVSLFNKKRNIANLMVCHLKSQRGIDFGIDKRYQEIKYIVEAYQSVPKNIPFFLMGDFNGIATRNDRQFEYDAIYNETDLIDCLELCNVKDRGTHISFKNGVLNDSQLDYIFVNNSAQNIIKKAYIYRPKSFDSLINPKSYEERSKLLPSDHLPLVIEIDLK